MILRKFQASDAENILKYAGDSDALKFLRWKGFSTLEEARADIFGSYWSRPGIWAIELAENDKVIGDIVVRLIHEHDKARVGYLLNRQFWGCGYAAEALSAVIRLCFEELRINRVEADHFAGNSASGRVMEKCGMMREGVMAQAANVKGEFVDIVYYGITSEGYHGKKLQ